MPRKVRVTERRAAGEVHQVLEVVTTNSTSHTYRKKPCGGCPWRKDQDGVFPAEAFRISAPTAYDMADRTFACHESGAKAPATCAGFLLQNSANNLAVRLAMSFGKATFEGITNGGHELHESYRAMAIANGVAPDDPVLAPCRANRSEA